MKSKIKRKAGYYWVQLKNGNQDIACWFEESQEWGLCYTNYYYKDSFFNEIDEIPIPRNSIKRRAAKIPQRIKDKVALDMMAAEMLNELNKYLETCPLGYAIPVDNKYRWDKMIDTVVKILEK